MVAALGLERYQCDQIGRFLKVLGLGTVGRLLPYQWSFQLSKGNTKRPSLAHVSV